jgi:hypothetical protein
MSLYHCSLIIDDNTFTNCINTGWKVFLSRSSACGKLRHSSSYGKLRGKKKQTRHPRVRCIFSGDYVINGVQTNYPVGWNIRNEYYCILEFNEINYFILYNFVDRTIVLKPSCHDMNLHRDINLPIFIRREKEYNRYCATIGLIILRYENHLIDDIILYIYRLLGL